MPGTEGVTQAFWAPDSQFVAFFADDKLKKVDLRGGPPQILCDAPLYAGVAPTSPGGTWSADGTILFGMGGNGEGLMRVSAAGGTPTRVTTPDAANEENAHMHPSFLPDGRHFLYVATSRRPQGSRQQATTLTTRELLVSSLDGGAPLSMGTADTKGIYADGFLLVVREGTLLAQPFDASQLRLS